MGAAFYGTLQTQWQIKWCVRAAQNIIKASNIGAFWVTDGYPPSRGPCFSTWTRRLDNLRIS